MNEMPLDAERQAERKRSVLRMFHVTITLSGVAILGFLTLAPDAVAELLHLQLGRYWRIAGDIWFFGVVYSSWVHHRLRPWCPYCDPWDDSGDEEPSPDPEQVNTKIRT